eukprot:scpid85003/ scgid23296/ 
MAHVVSCRTKGEVHCLFHMAHVVSCRTKGEVHCLFHMAHVVSCRTKGEVHCLSHMAHVVSNQRLRRSAPVALLPVSSGSVEESSSGDGALDDLPTSQWNASMLRKYLKEHGDQLSEAKDDLLSR